jgi:hypothetical protein
MRKDQTKAEQIALRLLASTLTAKGTRPMYSPDITDSPDALFVVENAVVAIECRYIAHPKLLEFLGRRDLKPNVPYEVVVPREPHFWVRDAINDKNGNIDKYMKNTGATEAWLLLHSSTMHSMLSGGEGDEVFKEMLVLGTQMVEHRFKRIWFAEIGGHIHEAIELFGPGIAPSTFDWDAYLAKCLPAYPNSIFWYSPAIVQEREKEGEKRVTLNMNDPLGKATGLQPLDTRYTIDYGPLSDPNRNSNLTGLHVAFFDEKPGY